jgi:mannose-6-phosphate isomerase-like protein (cupin superfamily)
MKHVEKGWGYEKWIVNKEAYCGKLLFFRQGTQCSWHYHKIKDETFYLQSGRLQIFYGWDDSLEEAKILIMSPGDNFHVPIYTRHRMFALEDSELFEFSTQHFDEDSYRIEKGD